MSETVKTPEQLIRELAAEPGVDIPKLPIGTKIIVETTQAVYELIVLNPPHNVVKVSSTDPRIKGDGVIGQLNQSLYDLAGKVSLPHRIAKNLRMQFTFANALYLCSAAISARVEGDGWHFEVF